MQQMQQQLINIEGFTIVPLDYKKRDPRQTGYNFRESIRYSDQSMIIYNKQVSEFLYFYALDAAQQATKNNGQVLVPTECLNWRRAKQYAHRRLYVGRRAFYQLFPSELSKREQLRLIEYVDEVHA